MRIRDFQALTFDCYGTLVDWERGLIDALLPWAAAQGLALEEERALALFTRFEGAVQRAQPALPYRGVLRAVQAELAGELGFVRNDPPDHLADSLGAWPAFPDTRAALAELARHHRLVIVSNVDAASFAATRETLGIDFDAVVTAEAVGAYKPDRRMFEAAFDALAELGVDRDGILHVAQSLFHDHVPAKALGLPTVFVDRRADKKGWGATPPPPVEVHPDWSVRSLAELVELSEAQLA